jgi:hypothetical protein
MHPGEVLGEVRPVGVMRWPGHGVRPGSSGRVWDRPPASADSCGAVDDILDQRSRDPRPGGLCHTPRDLTGAEQLAGAAGLLPDQIEGLSPEGHGTALSRRWLPMGTMTLC